MLNKLKVIFAPMKRALSILMILVLSVQIFSIDFVIIHFYLNRAQITEFFCINKDKPELACHGSCHLEKTLEDHQQKEQDMKVDSKTDITFFCEAPDLPSPIAKPARRTIFPFTIDGKGIEWVSNIFHPPISLV